MTIFKKLLKKFSQSTDYDLKALTNNSEDIFILRHIKLLRMVGQFMTLTLLLFGIFSFYIGQKLNGFIDIAAALILSLIILNVKNRKTYFTLTITIMLYMLSLSTYFFQLGMGSHGLYLWGLTAPLFLIFFLKIKQGTILSFLFLGLNILIIIPDIFNTGYSWKFIVRYSGVYITITVMSYIYGRLQEKSSNGLLSLNRNLNNAVRKLSSTKKDLQQSEVRYRTLVENSNDGIGILRDFRFIYVNTKLSEMSGYKKSELLKKTLSRLLRTEQPEMLKRIFDAGTWSGLPRNRVELNLVTKEGDVIEVEIGTNTIEYEEEQSQLIFIRDVRDRNLVEKERTKISNLESFRMVANGVTHDFNNILTIILGNLELIRLAGRDDPKLKKPISKIEEASGRATELLDDLYIFSTSSVKEESIELISEIIDSVLETLRKEFSTTKITLNTENNHLELRCDRKQIYIALKNILLNSLDATEGRSKIEISISEFSNQSNIVRPLKREEYIRVTITDSGKGIPPENIGKIFDPYFSTKGNVTEKGIGLGLAIANKIVLDHMGLITVDSKEGRGTTFNIYLPIETRHDMNR
ncbi:MAG: PAS domain-containing sensor histidine kinase [Acidobacteriota bacterium]